MLYWLGQLCGLLATVGCIIVPFFRYKWQMLLDLIITNVLIAANFLLIGQLGSAVFLCGVAVVQGILSMVHDRREEKAGKAEIVVFTLFYLGLGLYGLATAPGFVPELNGANLLELLPICGALLNMVFILVKDPKAARRVLLAVNVTWAVYSAVVGATAFFAQVVTLVTTLLAMYRYRNTSEENK